MIAKEILDFLFASLIFFALPTNAYSCCSSIYCIFLLLFLTLKGDSENLESKSKVKNFIKITQTNLKHRNRKSGVFLCKNGPIVPNYPSNYERTVSQLCLVN